MDFKIPAPNIKRMIVKIKGTAPLIFNRWSEKSMKMILDKQLKNVKSNTRPPKNPQEDYESSFYYTKDKKVAFPALCIKLAIVSSARSVEGLPMTLLRASVFIRGDEDGLIEVQYKKKEMRKDMVRVGMGVADVRFRGQVKDWSMKFMIEWNEDVLSASQLLNLIQIAGFSNGLGEWRPERSGANGTFELDMKK